MTGIALAVLVAIIVVARQLGSRAWAIALGLLLGAAIGNLTDRFVRPPGGGQGHVVDFIDYNRWFIGNVADIWIVAAAGLIVMLALLGIGVDGRRDRGRGPQPRHPRRDHRTTPTRPTRDGVATVPDVRTVLVPDGLEGERVDAGVARLFGVSRTKAADLAADGHVVLDGKTVGEVRAALGRLDARGVAAAPRGEPEPAGHRPARAGHDDRPRRRRHRRGRQAGRRRSPPERRAGSDPTSCPGSPLPATASRPPGPPSARAS